MYEVCHAMVLFPEVEGNRGICTPFFAYHGGTVRVFDCQWPGVHRLYVSSCQAGYLFFSDLVWFHFSHMLVFFVKHDRFGTGISISYMLRPVFCHDCARLGEKKYRSEARMIFSLPTSPKGRLAQSARQTATFTARNEKADLICFLKSACRMVW